MAPHGLDKLDHGLLEFSPFQGRCCICFQLSAPLRRLDPATTNVVLCGMLRYRGLAPAAVLYHRYAALCVFSAYRGLAPAAVLFHRSAVLFCRQLRSLWSLTSGYE